MQVTTLAGWSAILNRVIDNSNALALMYFLSAVVIGNFVLLNLILAVLKLKFSASQRQLSVTSADEPKVRHQQFVADAAIWLCCVLWALNKTYPLGQSI